MVEGFFLYKKTKNKKKISFFEFFIHLWNKASSFPIRHEHVARHVANNNVLMEKESTFLFHTYKALNVFKLAKNYRRKRSGYISKQSEPNGTCKHFIYLYKENNSTLNCYL